MKDPAVPKIYINGFGLGLSNADVHLVLQFASQPVAIVNLSFTLAKTLAQRLGRVVSEFESTMNTELVTTDKIDEAFKAKQGGQDDVKH